MLSVSYYRICQGPPGGWDCCSAWVPRSFQLPTTLLAKNSPPPHPWVRICLVPSSRGAADPAAHWLLQWLTSLPDPRLYDEDSDDKGHRGDNCLPSDCFLRPCSCIQNEHTARQCRLLLPLGAFLSHARISSFLGIRWLDCLQRCLSISYCYPSMHTTAAIIWGLGCVSDFSFISWWIFFIFYWCVCLNVCARAQVCAVTRTCMEVRGHFFFFGS